MRPILGEFRTLLEISQPSQAPKPLTSTGPLCYAHSFEPTR